MRTGAHRDLRIDARQLQCWNEPEDEGADDAQANRERQRQAVDGGLELDREGADHRNGAQSLCGPDGERRADRRTAEREEQALGEQQRGDTPWTGA